MNNVSFYTNSTVIITGSAFIVIKVKRPISYWHYIYINWPLRFTIKLFFWLFKQWYMIAICRLNNIVKTHSLQSHFSLFLWLTMNSNSSRCLFFIWRCLFLFLCTHVFKAIKWMIFYFQVWWTVLFWLVFSFVNVLSLILIVLITCNQLEQ